MEYGMNQEEEQNIQQEGGQESSQTGSQTGQPQSYRERPQGPQYYYHRAQRKPGLGKRPIMAMLILGMLLIAIGAVWLSFATVPDYDKLNAEDPAKRSDNIEDYQRSTYTAQTAAGILATLGTIIGGFFSLYGGFMSEEFSDEQKRALLILAGFFLLGLVLVFNHYTWMLGGMSY